MYTTTVILEELGVTPDRPIHAPHVMQHRSMAELKQWVVFNNMCLGTPYRKTPYFSVEHTNGSPLSDEEYQNLYSVAGYEAYMERAPATIVELGQGGFALNRNRKLITPGR